MEIIPEGKEMIWAEAVYKEPIEGIPFSNQGLSVGITRYVEANDKAEQEALDEHIQRLVESYFRKLADRVTSTRNELIDRIRMEVSEEKDAVIQKAKEEYLKLREENKELKVQLDKLNK